MVGAKVQAIGVEGGKSIEKSHGGWQQKGVSTAESLPRDDAISANAVIGNQRPKDEPTQYLTDYDYERPSWVSLGTAIPSRGWSDDLCYGTGTICLGGMSSMLLAISPHLLRFF